MTMRAVVPTCADEQCTHTSIIHNLPGGECRLCTCNGFQVELVAEPEPAAFDPERHKAAMATAARDIRTAGMFAEPMSADPQPWPTRADLEAADDPLEVERARRAVAAESSASADYEPTLATVETRLLSAVAKVPPALVDLYHVIKLGHYRLSLSVSLEDDRDV